jgi:ABC-type transporter Mla MlaB component
MTTPEAAANIGTITLDGELTLPRAEELKKLFAQALDDQDSIEIKFGGVRAVDLSFLQLVCSLHRSAVTRKKHISLEGAVPTALKETATDAGYLRLDGCKLDFEKSCLWVKVGNARIG